MELFPQIKLDVEVDLGLPRTNSTDYCSPFMHEHFFTCPHCFQEISMLLDPSVSNQEYIEDCEVCCNPIQINLEIVDSELVYFEANSIEQ